MPSAKRSAAVSLVTEDFETRAVDTEHQDLRLWLRMMTIHKLIINEARRRLRTEFGMSLSRFDLMSQLDGNDAGIRMGELSSRLMVTTGNITGLTNELQADGLVERMPDPTSRRAYLVRLTPKGRRQFKLAAKANEAWIAEFFSVLSRKDKKLLFDLFGTQKGFLLTRVNRSEKPARD
jgi:DNA-binding MarR family transcriptional regulator